MDDASEKESIAVAEFSLSLPVSSLVDVLEFVSVPVDEEFSVVVESTDPDSVLEWLFPTVSSSMPVSVPDSVVVPNGVQVPARHLVPALQSESRRQASGVHAK